MVFNENAVTGNFVLFVRKFVPGNSASLVIRLLLINYFLCVV